jgi:hypothetical protein
MGKSRIPFLSDAELSRWKTRARRVLVRVRQVVPPGGRLVLGVLLMMGGLLAFLPVLGLWMLPLGLAVASLDVVPALRWLRGGR